MANTKLYTPKVRLDWAQDLFRLKEGSNKRGCTLIFDPEAQVSPLTAAMRVAAKAEAVAKWGDKLATMRCREDPFLNGSLPEYSKPGYTGNLFIRVTTQKLVGFASVAAIKMTADEAEQLFWSGCYVRATLNTFWYDQDGNKGVSFGLRNMQYMGRGESLGGGSSADEDFTAVEDDGESLDALFGGASQ